MGEDKAEIDAIGPVRVIALMQELAGNLKD